MSDERRSLASLGSRIRDSLPLWLRRDVLNWWTWLGSRQCVLSQEHRCFPPEGFAAPQRSSKLVRLDPRQGKGAYRCPECGAVWNPCEDGYRANADAGRALQTAGPSPG